MQFSPQTLHQVWISIPVMVFAFSHTPIISTFAIDQQEKHGDLAMGKCKKIMKVAYTIICASAFCSWPTVSLRDADIFWVRSPAAMRLAHSSICDNGATVTWCR